MIPLWKSPIKLPVELPVGFYSTASLSLGGDGASGKAGKGQVGNGRFCLYNFLKGFL